MRRFIALALVGVLALAACSDPEPAEQSPVEEGLDRLTSDLDDGVLTQENTIAGEQFALCMSYRTDYDVESWRITDSKTLAFAVRLCDEVPATTTILIEHVHVDVNLDARRAGMDGLPQDSMDDSLHTGNELGFYVTAAYPYEEVFSIEGFSQTLISGWGFATSGSGASEINETRLTEGHLREQGQVEGNKLTFIYDVLVRYGPDEPFHKRVVVDEFIVPVG